MASQRNGWIRSELGGSQASIRGIGHTTTYPESVFVWRYLDAEGGGAGESEPFTDRESAESWLGETWSDLLGQGVEEVVLEDRGRGRTLYRMGLRES
jgi:hypothetical protein